MFNSVCGRIIGSLVATALCSVCVQVHGETGVAEMQVLLGQSAPLSGPSAELGLHFQRGASAYFDKVNADGGVHGRQIRLIALDDEYEPDKTVANTKRLIDDSKVFALFGYVGTPTSYAVLPLVNAAQIPFFAPVSGASFLREPFNPLIFNIRASYSVEIDYMLKQLVGNGQRKIAVLYQNDEFGLSTLDILRRKMSEKDMLLLAAEPVERNSSDVANALPKLMAASPDVVIEISSYVSSAALIKEMRQAGYRGVFYNFSFVGTVALAANVREAGIGTVITQVVPFPWRGSLPVVYEYQRVYGEKEGNVLSFSSLEGYLAARILVDGLRRAGRNLTRTRLIRALETINPGNCKCDGFNIRFAPGNHNGSNYVDISALSAGEKPIN